MFRGVSAFSSAGLRGFVGVGRGTRVLSSALKGLLPHPAEDRFRWGV